jgi:hypothetical protein
MKRQKEEKKEIDQIYDFNTNYIDIGLNQLLITSEYKLNNELTLGFEEITKEKNDFILTKFDFN